MEVYLDDVETDKIGGFDKISPGSYHLLVVGLNEEGGQKGEMIVDFEVLRGTTPGMEGKQHREYFTKDMKALPRRKILALAIGCGLTTKAELDQHKANGTNPNLDFSLAVNRQCCANFESNTYEGKTTTRLRFDEIFPVNDRRASHIPLNAGMIKSAGITLPPNRHIDGILAARPQGQGGQNGQGQGQNSQKPQGAGAAAPAQQASSVDDLLGGVY